MESTLRLLVPPGIHTYQWDKIPIKVWKFPAGEMGVRIESTHRLRGLNEVYVELRARDSDGIMAAILLRDAIRQVDGNLTVSLYIPYFPYARQDRVCNPGESASLAVLSDLLINTYDNVFTLDIHTEGKVGAQRLLRNTSGPWVASNITSEFRDPGVKYIYCYPDKGAFSRHGSPNNALVGEKEKCSATGKITKIGLKGGKQDLTGKHVIVIDDMCDGGGTSILIAEELEAWGAESLTLCVSHGIFSNGVNELLSHYDEIWTTDSYCQYQPTARLKVYKLL